MKLGELITGEETIQLMRWVSLRGAEKTVHHAVMDWFASEQGAKTLKRFEDAGYIPAFAAYLLEYFLKLT